MLMNEFAVSLISCISIICRLRACSGLWQRASLSRYLPLGQGVYRLRLSMFGCGLLQVRVGKWRGVRG